MGMLTIYFINASIRETEMSDEKFNEFLRTLENRESYDYISMTLEDGKDILFQPKQVAFFELENEEQQKEWWK